MAITKEMTEDKIEVVGDFKHIQVRTVTIIKEDGVELSRSYHRHALDPTKSVYTRAETDEDGKELSRSFHRHVVSPDSDSTNESDDVKAMVAQFHTDAVKKAYADHKAKALK